MKGSGKSMRLEDNQHLRDRMTLWFHFVFLFLRNIYKSKGSSLFVNSGINKKSYLLTFLFFLHPSRWISLHVFINERKNWRWNISISFLCFVFLIRIWNDRNNLRRTIRLFLPNFKFERHSWICGKLFWK